MDSLRTNISKLSSSDFKSIKQFIRTEQTRRTQAKSKRTRQLNLKKNREKNVNRDLDDITAKIGESYRLMDPKVRRSTRTKTKAKMHNVAAETKKTKKKKRSQPKKERSPPNSNASIEGLFNKLNLGSSSSPHRKRLMKKKSFTPLIPVYDDDDL